MTPSEIVDVRVKRLDWPMSQPFTISTGRHDAVENALVEVRLRSGHRGWGEAGPAPHITGETQDGALKAMARGRDVLLGQSAAFLPALSRELAERLGAHPAARAALEMAVLDAELRRLGIPAWRWFGGASSRLTTDVTIPLCPLQEAPRQAARLQKDGIRTIKVKIGKDPEQDLTRVLSIAEAAPRCALILDANQGYAAKQALGLLKALSRRAVVPILFEQPVPAEDWDGLAEVSRGSRVPVCADESVPDVAAARRMAKRKAARVVNVKLMKSGLGPALEIARVARNAGLGLMIGGMVESDLAMGLAAHAAAGLGWFDYVDLDTPLFFKGRAVRPALLGRDGVYRLAGVKAGIGVRPRAFS